MNDKTEKRLDFKFIYFLMAVFTTFSVSVSIFGTLEEFDFSYILVFIISLVTSIIFCAIFYNTKVGIVLISIIVLGFTIFALCTYYIEGLGYFIPIGDSIAWFIQFLFNHEPLPSNAEAYVQIISNLIIAIIALTFYFVIYKKELFYLTISICFAAYSFQINANYARRIPWKNDFDFSFFSNIFVLILFYFLYTYKKRKEKKNDGYTSPAKYLRLTFFITILVFMFIIILPKPDTSIVAPGWLDEKVWQFRDDFSNFIRRNILLDNSKFNLSTTGYSTDSKQLGGPVLEDDHTAIRVKTDRDIYLKGTVKDNYTGSVWRNIEKKEYDYEDNLNPLQLDIVEKEFSKTLVDDKKLNTNDMWSTYKINIKYQRIVTKSIFYPLKISQIEYIIPNQLKTKVNVDSTLLSDRACPLTFQYNVSSFDLNYNFPATYDVLRKSYKGLYNSIKSVPKVIDEAEFKAIKENSEKIYNKYTQIPKTMPSRVMELALKVTEKKNNNFDKVKAIETFLAYNYKYNTKPSVVPVNRDFVDYFLFDDRQGYCTYYASAMVMMVRSIGLPARYVEGFKVSATQADSAYTDVQNKEGHSWVEVYFDGIGWISFEPTTNFYEIFYAPITDELKIQFRGNIPDALILDYSPQQKQISDVKDIKDITPEPAGTTSDTTASKSNEIPNTQSSWSTDGAHSSGESTEPPLSNSDDVDNEKNYKGFIIFFIILSTGAIIVWLVSNYSRNKRLLAKIENMDNNAAVIYMFEYYFKVFGKLGYNIDYDETAFEYMIRISDDSTLKELPIQNAFSIFMKSRYGEANVSDKDKEDVLNFSSQLAIVAKNSMGAFTFYFYRMILGQI